MYADPSDPGNIRIASRFGQFNTGYAKFNIQTASNRVHEGIEHVRWLLKKDANERPRQVIHRETCPHMVKQMKSYRRLGVARGRNPTDARPEGVRRPRDYKRYGIPMESRE